ncbi:glycosyltransferase family 33 protein [Aulographum hederae CBS 113979]|uniref:Chitobiosyldiphosphodolichol beta-mannosyltransferase n=1 Tax=Aulographum hederae CBS 113979 TaxID=1176131 RepID=A0A6G1GUH7_9PEZI|nr:glycosyltransferase family 33 protein [Aulographum hederae CBS 113979]
MSFAQIFIAIWLPLGLVTVVLVLVFLATFPTSYDPYRKELIQLASPDGSKEKEESEMTAEEQIAAPKQLSVETSVQMVVLGDIGRSPRMQYHAASIAKHGGRVDIIGYQESEIHPDLLSSPLVTIVPLDPAPSGLQTSNKLLFLILGPLKVLWQVWSLYRALAYRTQPAKWMLVQNPPSIPTLAVAQLVCFFRNTRLVIDWHNFGYSILALKLGPSHPLVRVSQLYETFFSRMATAHFAVTNAMSAVLNEMSGITARPLHDRPPAHFQPLSKMDRSAFLDKLPETAQYAEDIKQRRWRLIVSSTSWTADEDFSLLLDALVIYSAKATTNTKLPKILAIITGKVTAWLSTEDYASLLGAADLGVSLHTSSSGVDLPMKVVDMFGAGLPVVGWNRFEAWPELVTEGVNGEGFGSADELAGRLLELFGDRQDHLEKLKRGALKECEVRWDDEWDPVAGKLFGLVK